MRDHAVSAGYVVRRLFVTHPLEDGSAEVALASSMPRRSRNAPGAGRVRVAAPPNGAAQDHRTGAALVRAPLLFWEASMRSSISSRRSDVVSALLVDTSECDRAVIADYLRAYPMPLLERLVAADCHVRPLRDGERYRDVSPALRRLGVDVDGWPGYVRTPRYRRRTSSYARWDATHRPGSQPT